MKSILIFLLDDHEVWYVDGQLWHNYEPMPTIELLTALRNFGKFSLFWVDVEQFFKREDYWEFWRMVPEDLSELLNTLTEDERIKMNAAMKASQTYD